MCNCKVGLLIQQWAQVAPQDEDLERWWKGSPNHAYHLLLMNLGRPLDCALVLFLMV